MTMLPIGLPAQLHPEQTITMHTPAPRVIRDDRDDNTTVVAIRPTVIGRTIPTGDRANQLALRFAYMLSRRQRTRGLLLNDGDGRNAGATSTATRTTKRRHIALSKSCTTQRRRRDGSTRRLTHVHAASDDANTNALAAEERRERMSLEATIHELRSSIAHLEQSQLLSDSARVTYRLNQTGVAVDACRHFFEHFAHGYDGQSTLPAVAARSAATRAFMASAVEPDIVSRDFCGTDAWLLQWQLYTTCYDDFTARMYSLQVIDDDDRYISISTAAEMRFWFTPKSIEMLFPHLHAQLATNDKARATAAKLYGRECCVALDLVFHFNHHGRLCVTESRIHLASALLDLTADPFAAMAVLDASAGTEDGNWQTPDSPDVRENRNALPKTVLWQE